MKAVFATDLSPASEAALDCLCACQAADIDEVVLLHVIDVDMYTGGGSVPLFLESDKVLLDQHAKALRSSGLTVRTRVEQGSTAHEIHRVVDEEDAGLIVMGNVGRGGLRGRALGSTAEAVASEAHVPVLIERLGKDGDAWCRVTQGHTFRRTLVAVDFSPASRRALDTMALMRGVEAVRLVHVVTGDGTGAPPSIEERRMLLAEWAATTGVEDATTETREGDPVRELGEAAKAWGATCIAAGLCGHGPVHRLMWGSVSRGLARTADVPVLLVPPVEQEGGDGA